MGWRPRSFLQFRVGPCLSWNHYRSVLQTPRYCNAKYTVKLFLMYCQIRFHPKKWMIRLKAIHWKIKQIKSGSTTTLPKQLSNMTVKRSKTPWDAKKVCPRRSLSFGGILQSDGGVQVFNFKGQRKRNSDPKNTPKQWNHGYSRSHGWTNMFYEKISISD